MIVSDDPGQQGFGVLPGRVLREPAGLFADSSVTDLTCFKVQSPCFGHN
jgi:hypothetical protein